MRSKANFKGHPIHPMLIPFPFAFLTGALLFDAAGVATDRVSWWVTGGYLAVAGIVGALLAAVPGLIDYLWTVPPKSSGKKRATLHLSVNLTAVGLFAIALWLRGGPTLRPSTMSLAVEVLALALLSVGGWMGGTLVSRNQIGVDHRYANAGKWREASFDPGDGQPVAVAKVDELKPDQMKLLRLGGKRVVLGRTGDGYVAFDDHCPHRGGSLADGALVCGVVQCPWHGSQFDSRTGAVVSGPARESIVTYSIDVRDGSVWLALTPARSRPSPSDASATERREEEERRQTSGRRERPATATSLGEGVKRGGRTRAQTGQTGGGAGGERSGGLAASERGPDGEE